MKNIKFSLSVDNINAEELYEIDEKFRNDEAINKAIGYSVFYEKYATFLKTKKIDFLEYSTLTNDLFDLSERYPSAKFTAKFTVAAQGQHGEWTDCYHNGSCEKCIA